ncbi:peptidoglycan DD-metalloendopeptidase family protein [Aurantimonas aggregata]|uniref:Peptidoglycan DD-metalloendopeptidase family protein n=1 Tax=Aurantimonas aggregata TaxID=2047720 RepID=A0A6L9MBB7_9HYPH|nr:M23 family metallopeptidase [Aurantimonas aggregata]NDV85115.1 peptidoglycan DD-metalloendopeptidase family protein [Aurantimonas aggregata]
MVRSAAMVALAGLAAGCSSDVARFDDGFYTGAVPRAGMTQTAAAQPYPGGVDQLNTGAIGTPAYQQTPTYGASAATPSVQSGSLPPPPAPNYGSNAGSTSMAAAPVGASDANRGAPPSTLQAQASQMSAPQRRPSNDQRTASSAQGGSVTVSSGDTLAAIARRTGTSVSALKQANGLSDDSIRIGQSLTVPGGGSAPTQVASNQPAAAATQTPTEKTKPAVTPVAYTPPATAEKSGRPSTEQAAAPAAPAAAPTSTVAQEAEQQVAAIAPTSTGISQFRWPVQGRVVNRFGEKVGSRRNDGLNISVPRGTSVKAAENGVVIYAGDGLKEFGNTVLVKHDNGMVTVYGHADTLSVQRGATVKRGQEVAKSGMSGDTDVPVLHFEVRKDSTPVDPTKFLQ